MKKFEELANRQYDGSIERLFESTYNKSSLQEIRRIRHESNASKIISALTQY